MLSIRLEAAKSVSFVIEHGQPNVDFVKRTLEALADAESSHVAAVATANKSDFIELHTADFLSHISSTHEKQWMEQVFNGGRHKHGHVTEDVLKKTSAHVTDLFKRAKHLRKLNKSGV